MISIEDVRLVDDDAQQIEALNSSAERVWLYKVDGQISAYEVFDLNGDGTKEIIIGTKAKDDAGNTDAGKIIVLNQNKERISEFNLYDEERPTIYLGATSPFYWVSGLKIADLLGSGQSYVVVMGHNAEWFSSRIVILAFENEHLSFVSEYWHPGFPRRLVISDLNGDGISELIISAANNSFPVDGDNPTGVFLLNSDNVSGQAPPYYGRADKGSELWYYLAQPANVTIDSLGVEDHDRDHHPDVKIGLSDSCIFYVNYEGEIIGEQYGTRCQGESTLVPLSEN